MIRFVALFMLAVILSGCGCQPCPPAFVPWTPTPVPATALPETSLTFTGLDSQDSAPFGLAGGTYLATWTATPPAACFLDAALWSLDDPLLIVSLFSGPAPSGTAYAYRVPPGRYRLHMVSSCGPWTVTLAPAP